MKRCSIDYVLKKPDHASSIPRLTRRRSPSTFTFPAASMKRTSFASKAFGFLTLIFIVLNVYVFLDREWESSFFPTSYATLYYPSDVPTIMSWTVVDRDRLQLHLSLAREVKEWKVTTNGAKTQSAFGSDPVFLIDTTFSVLNTYRLEPVPEGVCPPLEISTRFYSKEFYGSLGMKHTDVYIVRSNVPCGEFEQFSLADWVDDYAYVGKEGLDSTAAILAREVGVRDSDPTFTKMEKVTRYLRIKLKNARGVPKDDERWMNPWMLYNDMAYGTGKGWCTQHAQLYVYWANRAGIPTRFVFGARTQDNTIVYTGHAFAESWIKEQNRWAFVDLSHAQIYVTDRQGKVLNTAELFQLNQLGAWDSTYTRVYMDWEWPARLNLPYADTVVTLPFTQCNAEVHSEFTPHSIFKYRRPPNVEDVREIYTGFYRDRTFLLGNLERYLFRPQLAYSLYPTEGKETYYLRQGLFFGMVGSLILWVVFRWRSRRKSA
jgi:hypothetical protein